MSTYLHIEYILHITILHELLQYILKLELYYQTLLRYFNEKVEILTRTFTMHLNRNIK